jgi:penicillin-binding protein 1A
MRHKPDDSDRRSDTRVERSLGGSTLQQPGSRTAAAGWEFLTALGSDLADVAARMRRFLTVERRRPARRLRPSAAVASAGACWGRASGRIFRRFVLGIALMAAGGTLVVSCAILWALGDLPFAKPTNEPAKPTLLLEAANGEPLGRVGPLRAEDSPLDVFPKLLTQAVLSIEDRRFYDHFGIDPLGILRAAYANRAAGEIVEGGSTITQQLVKLEYLNHDRTYARKLREALLALWLEARLGKEEILTRYLNRVYLGGGAYGMMAAARLYFDKQPVDLILAEAAMLAGLIRAPSDLNPQRHLEAAQTRAATVLDAMVANHAIDAQTAKAAKAKPAVVKSSPLLAPAGSWFTDWVAKRAAELAGPQTGILHVRTTLVPAMQRLAQQSLNEALVTQGARLGVSQGALVAMRPDGAVLAMVGGRDYRTSQFNRAVEANRQPGSAFKLFVYLAALRNGYTLDDTIDGGPVDINAWQPENFGNEHYGRVTLADAFAYSVNTAAVRLAVSVGLDQVIAAARDLGIDAPLLPLPSLALGAVGVSLLDLTGAFGSVMADRMHLQPWGVVGFRAGKDSPLRALGQPVAPAQRLEPYRQPLVELLRGVVDYGTGRSAALSGFAAGKTGTSQNYRDAWFIGFNDALVVGVWLGNDDNTPMNGVVGGGLPASIWKQFITKATPLIDRQGMSAVAATNSTQTPYYESPGLCDYQACSSKYQSFHASDCTYQPYTGPRQLCELGQRTPDPIEQTSGMVTLLPGHAQCNIDACARFYKSFDPSDCTYQPYDGGPRQICER